MHPLRYRFHTLELGKHDIHYRALRDRNQFYDHDGEAERVQVPPASWPLFGVLWPAGEVLARLMVDFQVGQRRVLEVGCGIAMASMVLNKRAANITATDYNPAARCNLRYNTRLNDDPDIPFLRTGWDDQRDEQFGLFDLIIASDVLFEPNHAEKLARFMAQYAAATCEIIVVDAGRSYGPRFTREMQSLGFEQEQLAAILPFSDPQAFRGKIQRYSRA